MEQLGPGSRGQGWPGHRLPWDAAAKAPRLAAGPASIYGKAVSPPPSPLASPVAALKAKVIPAAGGRVQGACLHLPCYP